MVELVIKNCDTCGSWVIKCPVCGVVSCCPSFGKIGDETCPMCEKIHDLYKQLFSSSDELIDNILKESEKIKSYHN